MADFTSWADIEAQVKKDLANGGWKYSSYSIGGDTYEMRSIKDLREFLSFVRGEMAQDTGTFRARTCGGMGGGR